HIYYISLHDALPICRISIFSNKSTNQVVLSINGSELQLAAQDIDFSSEGTERMDCEYDGEDLQIAFNAKFLVELLNASDSEDVRSEEHTSELQSPDQ